MKLIRLRINQEKGFRSLQKGFEINFLDTSNEIELKQFNPYILAGTNGSGKSNILEALAEIFFHLDCMYLNNKPDYFDKSSDNKKGFNPKKSRVDAFELEYIISVPNQFIDLFLDSKNVHVSIRKEEKKRPKIRVKNIESGIFYEDLSKQVLKGMLPDYVVGYASGNNETLSLPFFKSRFLQYDEYISTFKFDGIVDPSPETSLIYLDEAFSQAIMLTNLLMNGSVKEGEKSKILEPFRKYVKLNDVESFRLIIRKDTEVKIPENIYFESGQVRASEWQSHKLIKNLDQKIESKSYFLTSYLEKLKRCATAWSEEFNYDTYADDDDFEEFFDSTSYLILDYNVNKATKEAFQFHFENDPLKLFEILHLLLVLNYNVISVKKKQQVYSSENIFINQDIDQKPAEEYRILRFKDFFVSKTKPKIKLFTKELSDGEHQFLHALGLCLLFKDKRTLFLLDEPETHFNPDWKATFISSIRHCFNDVKANDGLFSSEVLITTHSPFLISDTESDYVRLFVKDEDTGEVECAVPEFQTLGASINDITVEVFDKVNTIGDYALEIIEKYKKRISNGENPMKLIKEMNKVIGSSIEKTIFINQIIKKKNK